MYLFRSHDLENNKWGIISVQHEKGHLQNQKTQKKGLQVSPAVSLFCFFTRKKKLPQFSTEQNPHHGIACR